MAKATTDTCKSARWCLSDRQRHRSFIQFLRRSSGRWMRQSGRERARGGVVLVFPHYLKKNTADRQRKKDTQTLVRLWCCTRIWQKQLRDAALSIIPLVDRRAHRRTHTHRHTNQGPDRCTMGGQCCCVFLQIWPCVFVLWLGLLIVQARKLKMHLFPQTSYLNVRDTQAHTCSKLQTHSWFFIYFFFFNLSNSTISFDFRVLDSSQYIVINLQEDCLQNAW